MKTALFIKTDDRKTEIDDTFELLMTSDRDLNDFLKTDDRNHFLESKIDHIFMFLDHISKKVEKHLLFYVSAVFSNFIKNSPSKISPFSKHLF